MLKNQLNAAFDSINRKAQIIAHMTDHRSIMVEIGEEWNLTEFATSASVKHIVAHHSNDQSTILAVDVLSGCKMMAHYHKNEESITCAKGRIRVMIAGEEVIMTPLDSKRIPARTVHSIEALEDSLFFSVWVPKFNEVL